MRGRGADGGCAARAPTSLPTKHSVVSISLIVTSSSISVIFVPSYSTPVRQPKPDDFLSFFDVEPGVGAGTNASVWLVFQLNQPLVQQFAAGYLPEPVRLRIHGPEDRIVRSGSRVGGRGGAW
jgi:hypothetical protein